MAPRRWVPRSPPSTEATRRESNNCSHGRSTEGALSVTHVTHMWVEFESGKFRAMTDYTGGGTQTALYSAREQPATDFDWRFYRGRGVTLEQIEGSLELLRLILERPGGERALQRAEMLHRANSALVQRDMAGALISAWTASEGLIGDLLR